jgi:N-acyl homoserine lactone hydrolase
MTGLGMSAMNVGPLSVDTNLLVAFAPGHLEIPTTAAVIVHPTHGVGLWDTSINGAVADTERPEAYWGVNAATAFALHAFRREHAVDAQLEKLGIKPKEVRHDRSAVRAGCLCVKRKRERYDFLSKFESWLRSYQWR